MTIADGSPPRVVQEARAADTSHVIQVAGNYYGSALAEVGAPPKALARTLPRNVRAFTGRKSELKRLTSTAGRAGVVVIHAVNGMPGVGKTALVISAAHLLAVHFPDGQLFVPLHAHTPRQQPADPSAVLAVLLTVTGLSPQQIPEGLDARALLWRDRLSGKKVLLVLDDAADRAQVEPLLPGSADCLVLITSRRRLIAFDDAEPLPLDTLPPRHAAELFRRLTHRAAASQETGAVAELVRLCGYLPLAIVLLAGRLAHHPTWNIAQLAGDFAVAHDRLTELAAGDRAVAAAFELSYRDLPAVQQRVFRRLGLNPGVDIDAYATAALTGIDLFSARSHLDALYTDHLIDEPSLGRYRLHDLIRAYAHALAIHDDSRTDRDRAVDGLLDYYIHAAETASKRLARYPHLGPPSVVNFSSAVPDLGSRAAALIWMRTEGPNLLACIGDATTHSQNHRGVRLTAAIAAFLRLEGSWEQTTALHRDAAAIAHHTGDRLAEANSLFHLGDIQCLMGNNKTAADLLERALALYRDLGNRLGEAVSLCRRGNVWQLLGEYSVATDLLEEALAVYRDLGNGLGQANCLEYLGHIRDMTGDYRAATDLLGQALALYRDLGDRVGEAGCLVILGSIQSLTGRYAAGTRFLEQALNLYRDHGNRLGEGNTLVRLAVIRNLTGDYSAAIGLLERGLVLFRDIGNRLGEANSLLDLGRVMNNTGNFSGATDMLDNALALYRKNSSRIGEANTLHELGRVGYLTNDYPSAADLLEKALALFRRLGDRLGEVEVLNSTGEMLSESGRPDEALAYFQISLPLAHQVQSPLEEARALEGTARCQMRTGNPNAAMANLRNAIAIYQHIGAAGVTSTAAYLAGLEDENRTL